MRIYLQREVLGSSMFLLLADPFFTQSEVKCSSLASNLLPVRKAQVFLISSVACQSYVSCVQQTNENVFFLYLRNAFASVAAFRLKTGNVLGSNKTKVCVTICVSLCAFDGKTALFCALHPADSNSPLPKPTTEKVDLTYFVRTSCRLARSKSRVCRKLRVLQTV